MSQHIPPHPIPSSDFPSDVLKWMKINLILKPKVALKLMQTNKYFQQPEFPYFVIKDIDCDKNGTFYVTTLKNEILKYQGFKDGIETITKDLWIIGDLSVSHWFPAIVYKLLNKIACCDMTSIHLADQSLSYDNFKTLTAAGNIRELCLVKTFVHNEKQDTVYIEDILKCVPNLKNMECTQGASPRFSANFINTYREINASKIQFMCLDMKSYGYFEAFKPFMDLALL